jgi:hypothetical protein
MRHPVLAQLVLALGVAFAAGSCATMTPEACQVADWGALGVVDGQAGATLQKFEARQTDCAKVGVQADFNAYARGRDSGLRNFCQPGSGFHAGLSGYTYQGVCPGALEADFMLGYADGRVAYDARQALSSAESAVSSARSERNGIEEKLTHFQSELTRKDATEAEKATARTRIEELRRDRRRAEDRIRDAEFDRNRAAFNADRVRADIGMRWGSW